MTAHDIKHIEETINRLQVGQAWCEHCSEDSGYDSECVSDCYTSEIIMTSKGYVEVWASDEIEDYESADDEADDE